LLAALPEQERFSSWRLALADGRLLGYGTGIVALTRVLRATQPLAGLLERVPPRLLDRLYGIVARQRAALGRVVPDRPGPIRFP
jgi:predicted DCC family thiol-disulfide oxidoreductase YuxK